jgi:hypothetical protein
MQDAFAARAKAMSAALIVDDDAPGTIAACRVVSAAAIAESWAELPVL